VDRGGSKAGTKKLFGKGELKPFAVQGVSTGWRKSGKGKKGESRTPTKGNVIEAKGEFAVWGGT